MSNIVFLVEGQQGARREKSNTSISVVPRSGALHREALFRSSAPSLSARPDLAPADGAEEAFARRLGSRSCTSSSQLLPSARKGEGRPPSLAGRVVSPRQADRQPDDGMEEGRSCDVRWQSLGPAFPSLTRLRVESPDAPAPSVPLCIPRVRGGGSRR